MKVNDLTSWLNVLFKSFIILDLKVHSTPFNYPYSDLYCGDLRDKMSNDKRKLIPFSVGQMSTLFVVTIFSDLKHFYSEIETSLLTRFSSIHTD